MGNKAPIVAKLQMTVPGQGTAGTDDAWNIGRAPFPCTVTAVTYVPEATITGHATNNRTFSLINKAQDGSGTTSVAAKTSTADLTGDDENTITLSGTAANLILAEGDILEWDSNANASGVADPGGLVVVTISRNDS